MLHIQKFLRSQDPRSAVAKAVEKWGLKINEDENLVQFTYSQIDSPHGVPEVEECRGLILEKLTWNVVAHPFYRFYNWHEGHAAKVNLDSSILLEKIDGSLITLYWYEKKQKWQVATRGRLDASGTVGHTTHTFEQWFWEIVAKKYPGLIKKLSPSLCYTLEIFGPDNRVVTPYTEGDVCLLTARDTQNWEEVARPVLESIALDLGLTCPKWYAFKNREHIQNLLSMLPALDEGFVLVDYGQFVDGNYARIKIKNPSYLAAAHMIGKGFTDEKAVDVILNGNAPGFVSYFPEYKDAFQKWEDEIDVLITVLEVRFKELLPLAAVSRKEFALKATKEKCPAILFGMLDKKFNSVEDGLKKIGAEKVVGMIR